MLQEREFERLGGTETIRANIRLVAATNKDLEKAIAAGEFREDLYYRLNVFAIFVPPLRERKPDILLLADHFLEKFSREHGKKVKRISTPAIDMLASYHWPGNVRELGQRHRAGRRRLRRPGRARAPPAADAADGRSVGHRPDDARCSDSLEAFEKDALQDALKSARGNRAKAARLLSHDRADLQLPRAEVRDRLAAVQGLSQAVGWSRRCSRKSGRAPTVDSDCRRASTHTSAHPRDRGDAVDRHDVGGRPHVDLVLQRGLQHGVEGLAHLGLEPLVHFLLRPEVAVAVLHPLEVRRRHAAAVGQDVGHHEHAALVEVPVRVGRRRAVGAFDDDLGPDAPARCPS